MLTPGGLRAPSGRSDRRENRTRWDGKPIKGKTNYEAGVKLLLPGQDPGIDLGQEYALARGMVGGGEG